MMITLSKIKVGDKVSSWIDAVNNIIDLIKLAVAPTYDADGNIISGNHGYMSMEDKKIIDELPLTYMPIKGELPGDATWNNATITNIKNVSDTDNTIHVTIKSNNVIVYNNSDNSTSFKFQIASAAKNEYSVKTLCFLPNTMEYVCGITYNGGYEEFVVSPENPPLVLKILFVGGSVTIADEGLRFPDFKTINGESIIGEGNFELLRPTDLKTINNESLVGDGDIKMLVEDDFKTINGESVVGDGDITTLQEKDFKTINNESLVGAGDIKMLVEDDFKTIEGESIVGDTNITFKTINGEGLIGEGDIITLQASDFKTINGEGLIGEGNFTLLVGNDLKTINGESLIGIGDIVTLQASDFKTINGESIIGTGNIVIEGGSTQQTAILGKARLGEMVLGAKTL